MSLREEVMSLDPYFLHYKKRNYELAGVLPIQPMTALEISEDKLDEYWDNEDYFAEEKFDGTRGVLHFYKRKPLPESGTFEGKYLFPLLIRGSNIVGGLERIYHFFVSNDKTSERVKFLKDEYGTGGSSVSDEHNIIGHQNFDSRGYEVAIRDIEAVMYTWSEIAEYISRLIDLGHLFPLSAYTRCFSRRVSKQSDWYCENTDSLPQLRGINIPELDGTIIDGEMFIPNKLFKDVASVINCKWDKAIQRQFEDGFIVFHAFDVLYYKGVCLKNMPLDRRKVYLKLVVDAVNSEYLKEVEYMEKNRTVVLSQDGFNLLEQRRESFPNLYETVKTSFPLSGNKVLVDKRAYYEYIVLTGGEGIILKEKKGKYYHKRAKEYLKIKKFSTWDVVVLGFSEPTKEYKGRFPNDRWSYWVDPSNDNRLDVSIAEVASAKELKNNDFMPVSKFYYYEWVGNIRFGVIIKGEELKNLPKDTKFNVERVAINLSENVTSLVNVLEVGECSGFDEEQREAWSKQRDKIRGEVIEVKANDIFKKTGRLRHPRFLRERTDKSAEECTWGTHVL